MISVQIKQDVLSLRSNHWELPYAIDELVPLPDGTTYNAYLVKGSEKTALIDTVYPQRHRNSSLP